MGFSDPPPRYEAPQPSAEEQALAVRTAEQNKQATQADARTDTARLMAIYGTRLAMGGQSVASPLLSAPGGPTLFGAPTTPMLPTPDYGSGGY